MDVHRLSIVASVFDDFGDNIVEREGEKCELLVERIEEFSSVKR